MEQLQANTIETTTLQGVPAIWMWLAFIEAGIIIFWFLWYRYRKSMYFQTKAEVLRENPDLKNIFNSAFHAEPLYRELSRACHPDRFAPDENKMRLADELFQRITKNRNNIKGLLNLKEEVKQKLNIEL